MAYTTPATWTAGEVPTAAKMNAQIRDNISFLANPAAARVYNNANIALADSTETTVTFNTERFDPTSMHSTSSNTGRITIATAGVYVITFNGILASGNDYSLYYAYVRLNGATNIGGTSGSLTTASSTPNINLSTIYKLGASDYVEIRIYQDNTANASRDLLAVGNSSPEFAAVRLGIG